MYRGVAFHEHGVDRYASCYISLTELTTKLQLPSTSLQHPLLPVCLQLTGISPALNLSKDFVTPILSFVGMPLDSRRPGIVPHSSGQVFPKIAEHKSHACSLLPLRTLIPTDEIGTCAGQL